MAGALTPRWSTAPEARRVAPGAFCRHLRSRFTLTHPPLGCCRGAPEAHFLSRHEGRVVYIYFNPQLAVQIANNKLCIERCTTKVFHMRSNVEAELSMNRHMEGVTEINCFGKNRARRRGFPLKVDRALTSTLTMSALFALRGWSVPGSRFWTLATVITYAYLIVRAAASCASSRSSLVK